MNQHSLQIRQEEQKDFTAVYEIHRLAFERDEEAQLVERLRNSNAFIPELSLVAWQDGQPAGHILFTKINIRGTGEKTANAIALAPVAVLPGLQSKGIGGALITRGFEVAAALGYEAVIVLGHEHYYPKFGFVPADKWGITAPFEVPAANFMAIELKPGALTGVSGVVAYAKEFEGV